MKKLLIIVIVTLGALACSGENDPKDPSNDSATISCNLDTIIVGESGGKFTVTVSSKTEWSATANNSWVSISPNSGQGDAFVTINVDAGKKDEARVLFSNGESSATLVVYREDISCEPKTKMVSTDGEEFSVTIESHSSWSAISDKSWVTITPKSSHGNAIVNVCVSRGSDDKAHVIFYSDTSSDTLIIYGGGMLPGKFSVSASKQVHFSQGNLQYQASTNTWRFAENQYDTIGSANSNISENYDGWIDLFGWGTGNSPTKTIKNSNGIDNDYPTFTDWGINAISNGGNKANLWRTLTKDEWQYIFKTRTDASTLYGFGFVNGISGMFIFPDNWQGVSGISFISGPGGNYDNIYTIEQWSTLESSGAVFLPAAGYYRWGTDVYSTGAACYWTATNMPNSLAYVIKFGTVGPWVNFNFADSYEYRGYGNSVRLVR